MPTDVFEPDRRTIGQVLSRTSPPIRVPDYQRDFSWSTKEVADFWEDIIAFDSRYPENQITGKQYFLGATVLVNVGEWHLLLDGQQRLATATILLAALRDKMRPFRPNAANQVQDNYIAFEDHLSGGRQFKLELNVFDRPYFRSFIQSSPRGDVPPTKRSHRLIRQAYDYLSQRVTAGWEIVGSDSAGFDWAARIAKTVTDHVSVISVTSTDEDSAGAIFETLNDRGIGLSPADLLRSWLLQRALPADRDEIIECWSEVFECCGTSERAQTLIRLSWVAQHGDVKARKLHQVIKPALEDSRVTSIEYSRRLHADAQLYQRFREGDTDDLELADLWVGLRAARANAGYALLIAAGNALPHAAQSRLGRALMALVIRYNILGGGDRTKIESAVFKAAQSVSAGEGEDSALQLLRELSPTAEQFETNFTNATFKPQSYGVARYILREIERSLRQTQELDVNPPDRVHLEHIYPQNPPADRKWPQHSELVHRLGNITLLDRRLNEQIKNADFATKKELAYRNSELKITLQLLDYDDWSPDRINVRQELLARHASAIWPENLLPAEEDTAVATST